DDDEFEGKQSPADLHMHETHQSLAQQVGVAPVVGYSRVDPMLNPKIKLCANGAVVLVGLLCCLYYPNVGDILGYAGAIGGGMYAFLMPVLTHKKIIQVFGRWDMRQEIVSWLCLSVGATAIIGQFLFT
ncbi:hypothetical protein KIPB_004806, partial [Kipferlia bialata]